MKPDASTFDINFSLSNVIEEDGEIIPEVSGNNVTAMKALIDNSGDPLITGLKAVFTEPGQSATYKFYSHNKSNYRAFLKSITYENVQWFNTSKRCIASEGTSKQLVASACEGINVSLKVGSETFNGSKASIENHFLEKNEFEEIYVTIKFEDDSDIADGEFTVDFGNIILQYSTID